jgi:hypothetical protein
VIQVVKQYCTGRKNEKFISARCFAGTDLMQIIDHSKGVLPALVANPMLFPVATYKVPTMNGSNTHSVLELAITCMYSD